jgi:hypothetical protein
VDVFFNLSNCKHFFYFPRHTWTFLFFSKLVVFDMDSLVICLFSYFSNF